MTRADAVAIGIAVAAALAGAALHAELPVSDSAVFEYGGRAIVRGHLLYRDVWDNKLPGVFLVNALWQRLFDGQYRLHALAEAGVALASSLLLGALLRAFERPRALAVALAAILLAIVPSSLNTSEAYALVPILSAALAAARGRNVLAGVLVAVAATFWVPALLMLIPLAPVANSRVRLFGGTVLGLAVLAALFIGLLGTAQASSLVRSWFAYLGERPASEGHHRFAFLAPLLNLWTGLVSSGAAIALALLGAVVSPPRDRATRFGIAWSTAMLAGTCVGTRFYGHYFVPSVAALLFTAAAYDWRLRERWRYALVALAVLLAIPTLRASAGNDAFRYARAARDARTSAAIVRALPETRTLEVSDGYEPTLYLAAGPRLRSPYEIVASANPEFARASSGTLQPADVTILVDPSTAAPRGERLVCPKTAAPWRLYVQPALAERFAGCT